MYCDSNLVDKGDLLFLEFYRSCQTSITSY